MKFYFIGNGNIVKKYTKKKYTKLKTKINELEIMEKHHYFTQLMIQIAKRNNRRLRKPRHRRSENLDKKKVTIPCDVKLTGNRKFTNTNLLIGKCFHILEAMTKCRSNLSSYTNIQTIINYLTRKYFIFTISETRCRKSFLGWLKLLPIEPSLKILMKEDKNNIKMLILREFVKLKVVCENKQNHAGETENEMTETSLNIH